MHCRNELSYLEYLGLALHHEFELVEQLLCRVKGVGVWRKGNQLDIVRSKDLRYLGFLEETAFIVDLACFTHQISASLQRRVEGLLLVGSVLSGLVHGFLPCLCPFHEGSLIVFPAVEPFEYAVELNLIFLEDDGDADHIFFMDCVIQFLAILILHPHTALALIQGNMAVAVEVDRESAIDQAMVEVIVFPDHLVDEGILASLLLLQRKFGVGVVEVLEAADESLLREVEAQLMVYLLLEVVDAGVWGHLQHPLYSVIEHLSLPVDCLVVDYLSRLLCFILLEVILHLLSYELYALLGYFCDFVDGLLPLPRISQFLLVFLENRSEIHLGITFYF